MTDDTPRLAQKMSEWQLTWQTPAIYAPEGKVVWTKIHDKDGERNVAQLKRRGNLWFLPDGSMYVYYTPTHFSLSDSVSRPDHVDGGK